MTEAKHSPLQITRAKLMQLPKEELVTELLGALRVVVSQHTATSLHAELVAALENILSAESKFRSALPPDWEGDPLHDVCEAARAIVQKARQK